LVKRLSFCNTGYTYPLKKFGLSPFLVLPTSSFAGIVNISRHTM